MSNADLGVTERGIACQETPTLQPPTISFSQTSTHPPTPSLVVARLPFNLIIRASNILPWEYCLSHFQIFARAIVVKVWMWDILRWHIPPGWAFLMGVECIPFQPKHPPTSSVTRPCVQTLLRIGGVPTTHSLWAIKY